jgi:murein DD-endopeptidase MepM/ murein hydrolase activator NlpD
VHVFPLDPPDSGTYSPGGHAYLATDIFAPEETAFVAVMSGVIQGVSRVDVWNPDVNDGANRGGLFVSLIGDDGVRYYGSHLSAVTDGIEAGVRVEAGQLLGSIGVSGSARDTPPHLHFGISRPTVLGDWEVRRGEVDPVPFLDAWRAGETAATPSPWSVG